jgi:hypothetical protein
MAFLAATFDYNGLKEACHTINDGLVPFAYVMGVVGWIQSMSNGSSDLEHKKMSFVTFIVITALLAFWYPRAGQPSIVAGLWDIFSGPNSVSENIGAPSEVTVDTQLGVIVALEVTASVAKDKAENPRESGRQWSEYLQQVAGLGGIFFLQFAKIIQNMSLMIAGALGSLSFGLMMFQQTRQTAITFILSTVSVAMWPVGWALARFGSQFFLNVAEESIGVSAGVGALAGDPFGAMSAVSWSAVVSGWIVITTLGVPILLQSLVTYGASSFGAQFLGSAQGTALGAAIEGRFSALGGGGSTGAVRAAESAGTSLVQQGQLAARPRQ